MNERKTTQDPSGEFRESTYRVRLPGFLVEDEIGLGDVVKSITYAIGIRPCSGCGQRAEMLNRWMRFDNSSSSSAK